MHIVDCDECGDICFATDNEKVKELAVGAKVVCAGCYETLLSAVEAEEPEEVD